MTNPRSRKQPKRSETVELKARRLKQQLGTGDRQEPEKQTSRPEGSTTDVIVDPEPIPPDERRRAELAEEIRTLRKKLVDCTAEYRRLGGGQRKSAASNTVAMLLSVLSRPEGATKEQLVLETGAKKGYVDALLSRILPARGIAISSSTVEGGRRRTYRLATPSLDGEGSASDGRV